jgi:hypothetical protein
MIPSKSKKQPWIWNVHHSGNKYASKQKKIDSQNKKLIETQNLTIS